jgi:hypothetical protein
VTFSRGGLWVETWHHTKNDGAGWSKNKCGRVDGRQRAVFRVAAEKVLGKWMKKRAV